MGHAWSDICWHFGASAVQWAQIARILDFRSCSGQNCVHIWTWHHNWDIDCKSLRQHHHCYLGMRWKGVAHLLIIFVFCPFSGILVTKLVNVNNWILGHIASEKFWHKSNWRHYFLPLFSILLLAPSFYYAHLFWINLVFMLPLLSHFELHVYIMQPTTR